MTNTTSAVAGPITLLYAADVARWYSELAPRLTRWLEKRGAYSAREAEDIVQETFVRVITHAPRIAAMTPDHRHHYVHSMAAHVVHDQARDFNRRQRISGGAALPLQLDAFNDPGSLSSIEPAAAADEWLAHARPEAQPEQTTAARETLRHVWEMVEPQHRELLLLVAQKYTLAEMAAQLGITQTAVKSRAWRMRTLLIEAGAKLS